MMTDAELLERYVRTGADEAFATLVRRHVAGVYAAALRQMKNPALAEDVTQAVFILLSRRAENMRRPHLLAGWLLKVTRYCAADARKLARRRAFHERRVTAMRSVAEQNDPAASVEIAEQLDVHLAGLGEVDRAAIVLRCLEERSLSEVAEALQLSEEAAKKRVARALEKLRTSFSREGSALSAAAVAAALKKEVLVARPELADKICAAMASKATVSSTAIVIAKGAAKLMAWHVAKRAVVVGICVIAGVATTALTIETLRAGTAPPPAVEVATSGAAPSEAAPDTTTPAPAFVYVMGQVKRPGVYQLSAGTVPGQILSAAGIAADLRETGWLTIVRRTEPQQEQTMTLRIATVIDGVDAPADAQVLKANDVITIGANAPAGAATQAATAPAGPPIIPADIATRPGDRGVYDVRGQRVRPGKYSLDGQQITVKMALAAALDSAALVDCTVTLRRHGEGGADKVVTMDMKAVVEGREADRFLQAGDILEVSHH